MSQIKKKATAPKSRKKTEVLAAPKAKRKTMVVPEEWAEKSEDEYFDRKTDFLNAIDPIHDELAEFEDIDFFSLDRKGFEWRRKGKTKMGFEFNMGKILYQMKTWPIPLIKAYIKLVRNNDNCLGTQSPEEIFDVLHECHISTAENRERNRLINLFNDSY